MLRALLAAKRRKTRARAQPEMLRPLAIISIFISATVIHPDCAYLIIQCPE